MFHMKERQLSFSSLFKKPVHNAVRRLPCSYFPRKQLTFHANCLHWRQYMKCQIPYKGKIKNKKNISKCRLLEILPRVLNVKGSIFLKNRHFIIQERNSKLIYGINTIIKCGI